ncbi:hypothetical protein D915_005986 [Fasciola hepatica]|uniref:Nodal modulator 2 n=1 Tax=Fasciola hepatica TaxID=6192 RepID=A0A4E0R686_FASHE|nr:hypothetical protein D915_005986 [Fasciola hepatica]
MLNFGFLRQWLRYACFLSISVAFLLGYLGEAQPGATVFGCGGFIRWGSVAVRSTIDYQQLKVNLYLSESDTLKDVTEVLPNGAFSVPLYDHGPYRLKLAAPEGWYVAPANGYLLDLRVNPQACANDFNFEILGFTVTGQVVTFGLDTGPEGLFVRLGSVSEAYEVHSRTSVRGHFSVGPVFPGQYTLTVSDGEPIMTENIRAQQTVFVGVTNLVLDKPLILLGHFVRGYVTDFTGSSLSGVTIYLLTKSSTREIDCTRVSETTKKDIRIPPSVMIDDVQLACETVTDTNGQFSFNRLPGGDYVIVPHHILSGSDKSKPSVQVSFEPPSIHITVAHTDIQLDPSTFHTSTFQLPPGRVTWPNGQPIRDAKIFLGDSKKAVVSDDNGFYQIGFIQPGQYFIHIVAEDAEFADVTTTLSTATEQLPNFQPIRLSVCGRLDATDDLLKRQDQLEAFVQIKDIKSDVIKRLATQPHFGGFRFCALLSPGRYELRPDVRLEDGDFKPTIFSPSSHVIDVSSGPVSDIVFSQFTARITGRVSCLQSFAKRATTPLLVELSSAFENGMPPTVQRIELELTSEADKTSEFEFDHVYPGVYRVSVSSLERDTALPVDGWCWSGSGNPRVIHVTHSNLHWKNETNLDFVQTGFVVRISFEPPRTIVRDAEAELIFSAFGVPVSGLPNESSVNPQIHWKVVTRTMKICLPSAEKVYNLSVSSSCLKLNQPSPSQIRPALDCSPILAKSPLVRITVAQLPLLVQLSYSHAFVPTDRAVLTKTPIQVDVTQSNTTKVQNLLTQWSESRTTADAPPKAQAVVWADVHHSVVIKPRRVTAVPGQWSYTYIIRTDSVTVDLSETLEDDAEPSADLFEFAPPNATPSTSRSMTPIDFAKCAPIYHTNLTIHFALELGVSLYGTVNPAIKKIEVKLFTKSSQFTGNSTSPSIHQSLLPIDAAGDNRKGSTIPQEAVSPAVVDVRNTNLSDSTALSPVEIALTDTDGTFHFGPVPLPPLLVSDESTSQRLYRLPADPTDWYTVQLNKPGYEFTELPAASSSTSSKAPNWQFRAAKLSLVEVLVRYSDERMASGQTLVPLQGVLISIIGDGHRGNQFTDRAGLAHFVGLAPGQYYLRPMMKEYLFTVIKPKGEQTGQASPITVSEGISVNVDILAKRVAFALSGLVTSLARIPEQNVLVEAEWIPNPTSHIQLTRFSSTENMTCSLNSGGFVNAPREQAWTNETGKFEIRGLFPGCVYAVEIQATGKSANSSIRGPAVSTDGEIFRKSVIERAIPEVLNIVMAPHDTTGLTFFAIRPFFLQTLTVNVDTSDEFLSSLRLTLFPLDHPDRAVVKHDFSVDSILFTVTGPTLASVVGRDHTLRLESTLESKFYTNIAPQEIVVRLRPGKSEHLQFFFRPKLRSVYPGFPSSKNEL